MKIINLISKDYYRAVRQKKRMEKQTERFFKNSRFTDREQAILRKRER